MGRSMTIRVAWGIALGLGVLLVAGPSTAAERMHIGMPVEPPNLVHITVWLAEDLGYYKEEGLEVKITGFRGGPATHQALVGAGSDLDTGYIPGPLLFTGIAKGSKMKALWSMAAKNEAMLIAAPDIKHVKDLKGKKVAIEGIGGYSHIGFLSVAEPAGLTDKDVNYVRATPPQRLPFLLQGNVDAVVTRVEEFFRIQREKPVNELGRIWRTQPHYLYGAFPAHEDRLKERRGAFVKLLRAMIKANRFAYTNKEKTLDIAEKYTKQPRWALEKAYDVFIQEHIWTVNAGLPRTTVEWTNDLNQKMGQYDGPKPTADKLADFSVAQDAVKSLGGPLGAPHDPEY
jgi:ABC-type nitrate/sulfonate/bicarbonate transport system substrate-binding protein